MKIAINTRLLLKNKLEGVGWYTYEITKRIVTDHPEDEFIFFFDRPYDEAFVFGPNVTPVVLYPPARHPLLWWWWFQLSVTKALSSYKPDVFFSPDCHCSLNTKVPTVMTVHDLAYLHYPHEIPFWVKQYYYKLKPRYLKKADTVIAVSNFTKSDVVKHYQIKKEKIHVIYNGIREHFKPIDESRKIITRQKYTDGKDYFICLGSVNPRKNLERLFLAFDQYKQQTGNETQLLIVGKFAWQTSKIREVYENMQHKESVKLLGYVEEDQLLDIMASALAMVYPSLFEGFGLPVVEAMACKVPVITSKTSSLVEVAGDAALNVDPLDISAIVEAMQKITKDETLRSDLMRKGRVRKNFFNWDIAAKKHYELLKSCKNSQTKVF